LNARRGGGEKVHLHQTIRGEREKKGRSILSLMEGDAKEEHKRREKKNPLTSA